MGNNSIKKIERLMFDKEENGEVYLIEPQNKD